MKHFLVMPHAQALAHVARALEISKALRARGHRITFAGDGSYLTKLAAENHFEVLRAPGLDQAYALKRSRLGRVDWWTDACIEESVSAELALIDRLRPNTVISDFRFTLGISCKLRRVPLVQLLNAAWTRHYSVRERAPEHLGVTRLLGTSLTTKLMPSVKRVISRWDNRSFARAYERRRLEPTRDIFESMTGDVNLLLDLPEYGPTVNLPPQFHYVGPIVWEPADSDPHWLDDLDPELPTIYVTMGSTGHPQRLQQTVELCAGMRAQVVVTTGGLMDITPPSPNVRVRTFASGSNIMKHADAVVCQGGNGTICQAMMAGLPVVSIPTMHDQEFNAQRTESLGFGVEVSDLRFAISDLSRAIDRALNDTNMHANAERLARSCAEYDAPNTAAAIIEQL